MKRRQPLRRKTPLSPGDKPLKRSGRLKPVSEKRKPIQAEYLALRKSYLALHTRCQVADCRRNSRDVHHMAGRGPNLCAIPTWLAVCRQCHDWIHENPKQAREKGYLK